MSKSPHSIADHKLGADIEHRHGDDDFDHDHDHDFDPAGHSDPVQIVSLGLDIGSSSTQLAFSRLFLSAGSSDRAKRERETLYLSPITPTHFDIDGSLDEERLRKQVNAAFQKANLSPDDIDSGVVLLTGEAASRRNALTLSQMLAEDVGDLVCAAAGHHMEAMLAAHGSGAVEASRAEGGCRILLVDIGGGTTKLAVIENGRLLHTAAIAIGGRLLVIDRDNRIVRFDDAAQRFAPQRPEGWQRGTSMDPALREAFAEAMAAALLSAINRQDAGQGSIPYLTAPIDHFGEIGGVMFAGGVGEFVYQRETRDFGDLGRALGGAIARRVADGAMCFPLLPPGECIRATVLGASQHSLQLSGHTIHISDHAALLPCRNVPVVRPILDFEAEEIDAAAVALAIEERLRAFDLDGPVGKIALSFSWRGLPSYPRLRALADGIATGLKERIAEATPFYILIDGDFAMVLGRILHQELALASPVMVADSIAASDFDFVDIGRVRLPSHTVPVTIKSLLFGGKQG
jgi:ethanolamine utilization protein EutA